MQQITVPLCTMVHSERTEPSHFTEHKTLQSNVIARQRIKNGSGFLPEREQVT
jgi:hypothetical protein